MGNRSPHAALNQAVHRAEDRRGHISVESRYHRVPKHLKDDYDICEKVLGSGCNGHVVSATNKHTGIKVAVKQLKLHGLPVEKKQELLNEVEVFLCIDHPHVARLYEVYESADTLSLVMEIMEGGELYDRVAKCKIFKEADAAEATWQMLLAVNYLHSENIVHRDLKLENFLYENEGGDYLKLIDFGFSKIIDKGRKLDISCGTISYVAPEVLARNYGSQCDMWSLGVIVFVLLAGYMPFHGRTDNEIMNAILKGKYVMKNKCWSKVSRDARQFVQSLLVVEPEQRLTAEQALEHRWIVERHLEREASHCEVVDKSIADSLMCFAKQTRFRRACMQIMAWSLSREERAEVRGAFLELDLHHTGVIKLSELKEVLQDKFHMSENICCSVVDAFHGLDHECDDEIHYSDFLAAMMSSRLALHDELLHEAFRRFDTCNQGYISSTSFRQVLGRSQEIDNVFHSLDLDGDGKISLDELMLYLHSDSAQECQVREFAHDIIDSEAKRVDSSPTPTSTSSVSFRSFRALRFGSGLKRKITPKLGESPGARVHVGGS